MSTDDVSTADTASGCLQIVVDVAKKIGKGRKKKQPAADGSSVPNQLKDGSVQKKRKRDSLEVSKKKQKKTKADQKSVDESSKTAISQEEFEKQIQILEKRSQSLKRQLSLLKNRHQQLKALSASKSGADSTPALVLTAAGETSLNELLTPMQLGSGSGDQVSQQ